MKPDKDLSFWDRLIMENPTTQDIDDAWDHGILVSTLAELMARKMKLDDEFCREIALAGMVHDVGKLQVSQFLYGRSQDTLAIEEMQYVRQHPELGYEQLKRIGGFSERVMEAVLYHHENYDGSGFPSNLRGEKIPLAARILRVADVYAALTSFRPYRAAFDSDTAIEMMIDEVKHFDMQVFLALLAVVHSFEMEAVFDYTQQFNMRAEQRRAAEIATASSKKALIL